MYVILCFTDCTICGILFTAFKRLYLPLSTCIRMIVMTAMTMVIMIMIVILTIILLLLSLFIVVIFIVIVTSIVIAIAWL